MDLLLQAHNKGQEDSGRYTSIRYGDYEGSVLFGFVHSMRKSQANKDRVLLRNAIISKPSGEKVRVFGLLDISATVALVDQGQCRYNVGDLLSIGVGSMRMSQKSNNEYRDLRVSKIEMAEEQYNAEINKGGAMTELKPSAPDKESQQPVDIESGLNPSQVPF